GPGTTNADPYFAGSADIQAAPAGAGSIVGPTVIDVTGGGDDIWNAKDQFHYVYEQITGDVTITARVVSQFRANEWTKAAVMVREDLSNSSREVNASVTPDHRSRIEGRARENDDGTLFSDEGGPVTTYPTWIRLVRSNNDFTGFFSTDGITFTQIG